MPFPTKTSREHGVAPTGVHSSTKRFTPTRSGVWGCTRVPTSIELPKWPPTRAPWFDGVLPPPGDAFDCKDRGENSRSRGCLERVSGNTGSNPVRGTKWPVRSWAGPLVSRRRPFPVEGFSFRRLKAENGPLLEKTAPNAAPSPLPLKTPDMEAGKGVNAIGVNLGILRRRRHAYSPADLSDPAGPAGARPHCANWAQAAKSRDLKRLQPEKPETLISDIFEFCPLYLLQLVLASVILRL